MTKIQIQSKSLGVDVASYQPLDLASYASRGAKFAIVKVSEGTSYRNPKASGQITSARRLGMLVAGYHFAAFSGNTAKAQQEGTYAVASAKAFKLPTGSYLACDYETSKVNNIYNGKAATTAAISAFLDVVVQAGYKPLVYASASVFRNQIASATLIKKYGACLWVASYPTSGATSKPDFRYFPSMDGVAVWQFTDNWDGLNVDGNVSVLPLGEAKATTASKILDLHPLVKYDCAGAVVVTAANGAYTYKNKELKDRVKDTTTKQYTTLELLAVEGGAYKVAGGYIDGRAAVAKLNPLKDNPHKSGKCVVMQANTHILKTPAADAKKGAELEKGTVLKFNGRVGRFLKLANGAGYVTGNRAYIRL